MANSAETLTLNERPSQLNIRESSGPVDVARAEALFIELSRQLTASSQLEVAGETSRITVAAKDIEKGSVDAKEPFDLREYLTSSNDANQQAGIKHKHVGVTWEDLQVDVFGGVNSKIYVRTFGMAILEFFMIPFFWIWGLILRFLPAKQMPTRTILQKSSGVLKPGEMCLVLGCPGSGCTTFLKAIANQREGFARVSGDVRYAGMDAEEMAKFYKGEVVYNAENDIHIPTLTVAQTLSFALSTKTPGPDGRLPGISSKEFNESVQKTLLRMLNISHTSQTLVGDEFVRGVSGGERKRVSIAEMMATRARVTCWDNSTRGLDASTALDFVKCLRIMTDVLGQTTFLTLYQAGENIYNLFDKVLILDQGRQVYYGPPSEARAYFENLGYKALPRQSTADYLTGCTDPNERQFAPGRSASDTPSTPEGLENAFLSAPIFHSVQKSLEQYKGHMKHEKADQEAFRAAVVADKRRGVSPKSPYTLGFIGQVRALTIRQFQTKMQDKFHLYTSFGTSLILAIIVGCSYIDLPLTSSGAFPRTSVLFVALMITCLDAFGEVPMQMVGRPLLNKQTGFSLYRPAAISVANTLSDLPFSALRVFIFNIAIYFPPNLSRTAGGFWTFHLFTYLAFITLQGFFRSLGLLCTSFDTAFRLVSFCLPNIVQYAGYMIPVFDMQRWLFWIYYINPASYALAACMENEFMRISMECDINSIVPRNGPGITKYPNSLGPNQVCTLYGSPRGQIYTTGTSYIDAGYGLDVADLWQRNLPVLIGLFIFFQLTQILAIEYYPQFVGGAAVSIYAKGSEDTEKRNAALREKEARRRNERSEKVEESEKLEWAGNKETQQSSNVIASRKVFTWERLNYHVPVPGGTRRLLHNVNGYVKPGTLTALMGASGAGKTTCLDVLAQRKNIGVVSGDIFVDGRPLDSDFARGTAYAEQMDVHEGTATVREAIRFSAYLRQPAAIPEAEKDEYVEEMIELLELQDLADAMVFGLSMEARKRLTIGVELASKPELLLFLDEPTSGLDAQSAWNLVRFLRKLADQGQAILCTIHQPSSLLFENFDRLLLLESGGETVYFGDIGSDSRIIREYFARHGAICPPDANPAEYMLEAIGAGVTPRIGDRDWKDIWLDSAEYEETVAEIDAIKKEGLSRPQDSKKQQSAYATPFLYQLKNVVARNNTALWRSPDYVFSRLFVHAIISLFISLSFLNLGNSVRDLQYRVFGIFWVVVLPVIVMIQIEPMFILNRRVFIRESSSRIYSPYVFAIGQLIGEIPYSLLCAILYWVFMVYPMGFGNGAAGLNGTGFQLLIVIFMELFGVTLGQLIAAVSPSVQVAVLFNPFVGILLTAFCGVTIPYSSLNKFWSSWMYQLDPYTRTMASMVSTELHGLAIRCKADEFSVFNPPFGQTCLDWAGDFISSFGGYLDNPTDIRDCRYCQYSVGDEFFTPLNISYSDRWRDAFIFFSFFVFNLIATIIASRFLRYARR